MNWKKKHDRNDTIGMTLSLYRKIKQALKVET